MTETSTQSGGASTRAGATRVEPGARARAQLPDADYADAFCVTSGPPAPAGAWARRAFEGGPPAQRRLFRALAWRGLLGMHLGPENSAQHIAGWTIVADRPEITVMHVDSWMLTGRLVTEATPTGTTITTLLRYDRPIARVVWAGAGNVHRAIMPGLLAGTARSLAKA